MNHGLIVSYFKGVSRKVVYNENDEDELQESTNGELRYPDTISIGAYN